MVNERPRGPRNVCNGTINSMGARPKDVPARLCAIEGGTQSRIDRNSEFESRLEVFDGGAKNDTVVKVREHTKVWAVSPKVGIPSKHGKIAKEGGEGTTLGDTAHVGPVA